MKILLVFALAVSLTAGCAHASSLTPFAGDASLFSDVRSGSGTNGVEFKSAEINWRSGLGRDTHVSSAFDGGEWTWTEAPTFFEFVSDGGTSELRLWASGDARPETANVSFYGLAQGTNAIRIQAKQAPTMTLTSFNGESVDYTVSDHVAGKWNTAIFQSEGVTDGFTLAGTVNLFGATGRWISIEAGTVTPPGASLAPVPAPAALPFLLAGLGGLLILRRHRRR